MAPNRRLGAMTLEWEQIVVDAADPAGLAAWWADALGWVLVNDSDGEYEIRPAPDWLPGLLFLAVADPKPLKTRPHPDSRPDHPAAEVSRPLALAARRTDVGQGPE